MNRSEDEHPSHGKGPNERGVERIMGPDHIEPEELRVELISQYDSLKNEISNRILEFSDIWERRDSLSILKELYFCILTPQSKAITCWSAVESLSKKGFLLSGTYEEILETIGSVRFKYRKSSFIIRARERFTADGRIEIVEHLEAFDDQKERRDWLVKEVKGYGFKEASHFLRNIGLGEDLCILDRHILKNLLYLEVIDKIPSSLTENRYREVERKMIRTAEELDIPVSHLDLLLWYRQAGSIFK